MTTRPIFISTSHFKKYFSPNDSSSAKEDFNNNKNSIIKKKKNPQSKDPLEFKTIPNQPLSPYIEKRIRSLSTNSDSSKKVQFTEKNTLSKFSFPSVQEKYTDLYNRNQNNYVNKVNFYFNKESDVEKYIPLQVPDLFDDTYSSSLISSLKDEESQSLDEIKFSEIYNFYNQDKMKKIKDSNIKQRLQKQYEEEKFKNIYDDNFNTDCFSTLHSISSESQNKFFPFSNNKFVDNLERLPPMSCKTFNLNNVSPYLFKNSETNNRSSSSPFSVSSLSSPLTLPLKNYRSVDVSSPITFKQASSKCNNSLSVYQNQMLKSKYFNENFELSPTGKLKIKPNDDGLLTNYSKDSFEKFSFLKNSDSKFNSLKTTSKLHDKFFNSTYSVISNNFGYETKKQVCSPFSSITISSNKLPERCDKYEIEKTKTEMKKVNSTEYDYKKFVDSRDSAILRCHNEDLVFNKGKGKNIEGSRAFNNESESLLSKNKPKMYFDLGNNFFLDNNDENKNFLYDDFYNKTDENLTIEAFKRNSFDKKFRKGFSEPFEIPNMNLKYQFNINRLIENSFQKQLHQWLNKEKEIRTSDDNELSHSDWYKNVFNKVHKPEQDINSSYSLTYDDKENVIPPRPSLNSKKSLDEFGKRKQYRVDMPYLDYRDRSRSLPVRKPLNKNEIKQNGYDKDGKPIYSVTQRMQLNAKGNLSQTGSYKCSQNNSVNKKNFSHVKKNNEKQERNELKMIATALYDFTAFSSNELSFNKGDSMAILENVDKNWCMAECRGKTGLVPYNYIQRT